MAKLLAIVVVLCFAGAALSHLTFTEEQIKEFMTLSEECRAEVGAGPSDIDDIIKKKPAAGTEGKCLRSCLMKKYKVMDGDGKFVKAVAMEHATNFAGGDAGKLKIGAEIVDACASIAVPDDHCEAAETYGACIHEKASAHKLTEFDV